MQQTAPPAHEGWDRVVLKSIPLCPSQVGVQFIDYCQGDGHHAQVRLDRSTFMMVDRGYPPKLIDSVLAECGRVEFRHRLSFARVVGYCAPVLAKAALLQARNVVCPVLTPAPSAHGIARTGNSSTPNVTRAGGLGNLLSKRSHTKDYAGAGRG